MFCFVTYYCSNSFHHSFFFVCVYILLLNMNVIVFARVFSFFQFSISSLNPAMYTHSRFHSSSFIYSTYIHIYSYTYMYSLRYDSPLTISLLDESAYIQHIQYIHSNQPISVLVYGPSSNNYFIMLCVMDPWIHYTLYNAPKNQPNQFFFFIIIAKTNKNSHIENQVQLNLTNIHRIITDVTADIGIFQHFFPSFHLQKLYFY